MYTVVQYGHLKTTVIDYQGVCVCGGGGGQVPTVGRQQGPQILTVLGHKINWCGYYPWFAFICPY